MTFKRFPQMPSILWHLPTGVQALRFGWASAKPDSSTEAKVISPRSAWALISSISNFASLNRTSFLFFLTNDVYVSRQIQVLSTHYSRYQRSQLHYTLPLTGPLSLGLSVLPFPPKSWYDPSELHWVSEVRRFDACHIKLRTLLITSCYDGHKLYRVNPSLKYNSVWARWRACQSFPFTTTSCSFVRSAVDNSKWLNFMISRAGVSC